MPLPITFGAASSRGFGLFSAPAALLDEYFENVTMLLPGNGTNGAQNNTFLDSSTNAFTITRNGNTTQGTFSPYGSNWSNYFDGSGDFLSTSTSPSTLSGDFTVEAWVYVTSFSTARPILCIGDEIQSTGVIFFIETTGTLSIFGANGYRFQGTSQTVSLNTWTHVAFVRSSGTFRAYINGVQDSASSSNSTSWSGNYRIGAELYNGSTGVLMNGYISNFRVVTGTAVYTSNFTPSTSPLTAITNTSLLTCQSNRFIDNSSNAFAITVNGGVSVQRFSPFSPTASYSAATIGGSGYFDGSGDSLSSATAFEPSSSTSTFTIEGWVYPTTFSSLINIIGGMVVSSGDAKSIAAEVNTNGEVALYWFDGSIKRCTGNSVMQLNAWNYFAIVVNSNAISIYVNKTTADTLSGTTTLTNRTATTGLGVGAYYNNNIPAYYFNGYFSSIRYSTVARTISSVPTSPFSSDANTRWLLNFTNAGIIDNAMMNDLETVGNAQISTAQSKFGGGSLYFDGSGDLLSMPNNINLQFTNTTPFTVEFWLYLNATSGSPQMLQAYRPSASFEGYGLRVNSAVGNLFEFWDGTAWNSFGVSASTGSWIHLAVSYEGSGTTRRLFVNGVQNVSAGTVPSTINYTAGSVYVGGESAGANTINGYIDDLRITKGVARYTSNFTPPTAALPTR